MQWREGGNKGRGLETGRAEQSRARGRGAAATAAPGLGLSVPVERNGACGLELLHQGVWMLDSRWIDEMGTRHSRGAGDSERGATLWAEEEEYEYVVRVIIVVVVGSGTRDGGTWPGARYIGC